MPNSSALKHFAKVASQAAHKAGLLLARHAGRPAYVRTKSSAIDLVTEIDRKSETIIHRILQRAFPEHGFQGEERIQVRTEAPFLWIVDPVDGTTNFVHGMPMFAISIALIHRHIPVVGVIFDPIRKELFVATKSNGAFVNGHRISVSKTRLLRQGLLSTGFPDRFRRHPQPYLGWFKRFQSRCHAVRRIGCTALSLAYVASGRLDAFYEQDLRPWDIAAGILLVQEAGGRVTDFRGRFPALEDGKLVASNGRFHKEILRLLRTGSHSAKRRR